MKITYTRSEQTAKNIITFLFSPSQKLKYLPGQFIEINLPHSNPDKLGTKRWFTLSSSPTEDLISITTKRSVPSSTFKSTLLKLEPNQEISISDPMGDFVLPKDTTIPLVFVAGGIGVTPYRSMIKHLIDSKIPRDITLLYAANDSSEFAFLDIFSEYGTKIIKLIAQPLSAKTIIDLTSPSHNHRIYISGPEPIVECIVEQFKQTSISEDQLVTDYFPGYSKI